MIFLADRIVITMNDLVMDIFYFDKGNYFGSNIVKDTLEMLTDHFVNNQNRESEKTVSEMVNELQDEMTRTGKNVWRKSMEISCTGGSVKRSNPMSVFPEQ